MPWIQVEGVYDFFSDNDGFPTFLNKPSNLFFYYKDVKTRGTKFLAFGRKVTEIFGLVGRLPDDFDPKTWLSSGSLNKKDLFGDVIRDWMYYSPLDKTFQTVPGPLDIKAVCVDDEYFRCDSGQVYLNDTVTGSGAEVLNDPRADYFAAIPSVYLSIRPVFKHNRQNWYLYYLDGRWRVGSSYSGSAADILSVQDLALRPEYITNQWKSWTGTAWTTESGLRIKCRGIANGESKCNGNAPCNNLGTCVYTTGNETVCLCQDSAHGPYCENRDECSDPGIPPSSLSVFNTGKRPGDIATSFCLASYSSLPEEFYVCKQNRQSGSMNWMLESEATCRVPVPTTIDPPPPVTPNPRQRPSEDQAPIGEKPIDQSEAFMIFVIAFFACHIICPIFIYLGIVLTRIVRACRRTELISDRLKAVGNTAQGLVRTFSTFFNFTFWVWLCAVCVCLSKDQGTPRSFLFYWAVAMCGVCAVFVAIEAFFSCERAALHHLVSWEYIRCLQQAPPEIEMVIERYDWRHNRVAVYRTDIQTGRQTYEGTTDEWKKIGKKTVRQPFAYSSWTDESHMEDSGDGKLVRLQVHIDITLEGEAVESFAVEKSVLIEKTKHLNPHYDFSRKDSVPNHHPYVVFCPNKDAVPFWINEWYFWCATFLQLSWVYRWLFVSQTSSAEYTLRKKVFCNPGSSIMQTGSQQVNPDPATGPAQSPPPQVPGMPSGQSAANEPLISSQYNNRNYMSV